jgi:hypothetical protein
VSNCFRVGSFNLAESELYTDLLFSGGMQELDRGCSLILGLPLKLWVDALQFFLNIGPIVGPALVSANSVSVDWREVGRSNDFPDKAL